MEILAVIPARSGSKSVPHKNIREMNGKPMLAYSIEHAKKSRFINRIIVSTDSREYADIGEKYGAEIPFLRPLKYAEDDSTDYDVFYHLLSELKSREGYSPDVVVQLRPTYPVRNPKDIDNMIQMLLDNADTDSVRSIAPAKEIPYKMWKMDEKSKQLAPVLTEIEESYNMPRQKLPKVYYQNACIDVFCTDTVMVRHSMTGKKILGYVMEKNYDIDTEEEFRKAETYLRIREGKGKFVFDIDGVIAKIQKDNDYHLSEPNMEFIRIVNKLYDRGNKIVLFTARGYVTGIDWSEETQKQLKDWGVKYHELLFGKPNADCYVDDKMLSMSDLSEIMTD